MYQIPPINLAPLFVSHPHILAFLMLLTSVAPDHIILITPWNEFAWMVKPGEARRVYIFLSTFLLGSQTGHIPGNTVMKLIAPLNIDTCRPVGWD
jgi:hypothetical protein